VASTGSTGTPAAKQLSNRRHMPVHAAHDGVSPFHRQRGFAPASQLARSAQLRACVAAAMRPPCAPSIHICTPMRKR